MQSGSFKTSYIKIENQTNIVYEFLLSFARRFTYSVYSRKLSKAPGMQKYTKLGQIFHG